MVNEDTDHDLLARFYQNDDDSALGVFVERHRDWALTQARRYFVEEAEDIVQLSILRLRGPLFKRYFEDLSYREISNILKLSP